MLDSVSSEMCIFCCFVQSLPYSWCDFPLSLYGHFISEPRCWASHSLCHSWKISSLSPLSMAPFPDPRAQCESAGGQNVVSHHWDTDGCEFCTEPPLVAHSQVSVPTKVRRNCHNTPVSICGCQSTVRLRPCRQTLLRLSSWDQDDMVRKFILCLWFLVVIFWNRQWTLHIWRQDGTNVNEIYRFPQGLCKALKSSTRCAQGCSEDCRYPCFTGRHIKSRRPSNIFIAAAAAVVGACHTCSCEEEKGKKISACFTFSMLSNTVKLWNDSACEALHVYLSTGSWKGNRTFISSPAFTKSVERLPRTLAIYECALQQADTWTT